ncbi:PDZ domain-containing protein, partial [Lacticaseibacillus paracasei]
NEDGDVIGINSMMKAVDGGSYGFAIPSEIVQRIVADFDKFGDVRWAAVGIGLDWNNEGQILVKNVVAGTPAYGLLQAGDQIISISDGKREKSV